MNDVPQPNDSLVISYLNLRKAVGLLGMALPFTVVLGRIILEGGGLLDSISGYYYTMMRDVFVGLLCAIGIFLFSYRGYERKDDIAGTLACAAAVGVALFPTTPGLTATPRETTIGYIHLFFAACFFAVMAYFCLCLFTKSTKPRQTPEKQKRNMVYTVCGWIIVACIVLLFLFIFVPVASSIRALRPVLVLEAVAVEAFGVAWITKGEAILKDK